MSTTYTGIGKGKNIAGGPEVINEFHIGFPQAVGSQKIKYCIDSKIFTFKKQTHKDYEKENLFLWTHTTQRKKKNSPTNNRERKKSC